MQIASSGRLILRIGTHSGEHMTAEAFAEEAGLMVIPKSIYTELTKRDADLTALENGGVDSWGGYGDCFDESDSTE